jgi:hypothetical protein
VLLIIVFRVLRNNEVYIHSYENSKEIIDAKINEFMDRYFAKGSDTEK